MATSSSSGSPAPRLCPTCGTRVGIAATKCLVCGADLTGSATQPTAPARGRASRGREPVAREGMTLPHISLPLPVAMAAVGLFIVLGLVLVFNALGRGGEAEPTAVPAETATAEATFTEQPTPTETLAPTFTPLPPFEYTVVQGDTIGGIAVAFNVTTQSILNLNGLDPSTPIQVGQVLQIPQPTPTVTPEPSSTSDLVEQTAVARPTYVVQEGDTLSVIAQFYNVDMQALIDVNNLPSAEIRAGAVLIIPIDQQPATAGPTPTQTAPPPYPAPGLVSPADGAAFGPNADVTLQWATVGILEDNEAYFVTLEDVTCQCALRQTFTVQSTRLIVPAEFRPADSTAHSFRWSVVVARRTGVDAQGRDIYEPAGGTSVERIFSWTGGAPLATPTPTP